MSRSSNATWRLVYVAIDYNTQTRMGVEPNHIQNQTVSHLP